jgi:hypothetical protein
MNNRALMHQNGQGGAVNFNAALNLYLRALNLGNYEAYIKIKKGFNKEDVFKAIMSIEDDSIRCSLLVAAKDKKTNLGGFFSVQRGLFNTSSKRGLLKKIHDACEAEFAKKPLIETSSTESVLNRTNEPTKNSTAITSAPSHEEEQKPVICAKIVDDNFSNPPSYDEAIKLPKIKDSEEPLWKQIEDCVASLSKNKINVKIATPKSRDSTPTVTDTMKVSDVCFFEWPEAPTNTPHQQVVRRSSPNCV